jgi:LPS sulfotransferase NodH
MTESYGVRFVIFAAPRTGSNLLCGLLNAHPDILCHHGLFNPKGIHYAPDHRDSARDISDRDADPLRFLDRIWAAAAARRAVGFKMNRGENGVTVEAMLRDLAVKKILLKRRNRIRAFVSETIAEMTGLWESYGAPDGVSIPAIRVDPVELRRHAELNERYYAALESVLSATGQAWLETEYESLADRQEIARILSFLDVPDVTVLDSPSFKRGPADLPEVVANLAELEWALRGSPFFTELHDQDLPDLRVHRPAS